MEDCVCTETQNVTFEVDVSHPGIDALWTFKNQPLKAGPKYKIESKGTHYSLTVLNVMKDEEGEYVFAAGEKTSSAKLSVSGIHLYSLYLILKAIFELCCNCLLNAHIISGVKIT